MFNKGKTFLIFLSLFLGWEITSRFFTTLHFIIPPPSIVLQTLFEMKERLLFHTLITLKEMGGGFAIAMALSLPLSYLMFRFRQARDTLQPIFIVIQSLPMFTLAPIMVIWFGWGYTAIVIPTALMIFLPLTLNMYNGLRQTPPALLEFFALSGASEKQTFLKLRFRYALPHIFAGFRISAAIAGVGSVAGEWAGGQNGLGVLMLESRRNTEIEVTFAALFCLTALSLCLYGLVTWCEKKVLTSPAIRKKRSSRRVVNKWAYGSVLLLALPLFFVGCRSKTATETRLLLDWLPNPNHVPLFAGIEKGFFEKQGIHLKIQKVHEAGHGISYLTGRQADLLISHMPETFRMLSKGAPLTIIGCLIKEPLRGLTFIKDSATKKPSDLNNKVLGFQCGETNAFFLEEMLKKEHIIPKTRKRITFDLIAALMTQSVDFVYGGFWNIEPAQLKQLGVETKTFPIQQFGIPNYYEMIILAHKDSEQASQNFALRFQTALQQSINFCKENKEEAFKFYLKHQKDSTKKAIAWEKEAWDKTYPLLAQNQEIEEACVAAFSTWLKDKGLIDKPIDNSLFSPR